MGALDEGRDDLTGSIAAEADPAGSDPDTAVARGGKSANLGVLLDADPVGAAMVPSVSSPRAWRRDPERGENRVGPSGCRRYALAL